MKLTERQLMGIVPEENKKEVADLLNKVTYSALNNGFNTKHDIFAYVEYLQYKGNETLNNLQREIERQFPNELPCFQMKQTIMEIVADRLEIYE